MGSRRILTFGVLALTAAAAVPADSSAQQVPLGLTSARGQSVTPAYEGWYINPDGSFTLSFGYFNRNWEEVVDIPIGADNSIEPAEFGGMQPTSFSPRRHWGVFGIRVPADFGNSTVTWTLTIHGKAYSIPGHLKTDWKIDALEGEATTGNKPPTLSFVEGGREGAAPGGIMGPTISAKAGDAVDVMIWAKDDGLGSGSVARDGRADVPVTLTWFKHAGPGDVTFSEEATRVPATGGMASIAATFEEPGEYILRVRANDASGVAGAGHSQCCWTNGFVRVTVTR